MRNNLISVLTAGIVLASAVSVLPATADSQPATDPFIGVLPEWVPQNFADAMQFYNTHGKSYVADNVICLVRPMLQYRKDDYDFLLSGSMTSINTIAGGEPKIYELEIPKKPDSSDEESTAKYEDYCDSLGIYSHDYSFFESYAGCKTQYAFEVELFRVVEGCDLTVSWREKDGDSYRTTEKFSFENVSGTTAETDLYSWVPDCKPEFDDFFNQYGRASVHGRYIAYCSDVNYSTGASLKMEQNGDGTVKEIMQSDCSPFELIPLNGSSTKSVIVYQPSSDGIADIKWSVGREWQDDEPFEQTNGVYEISDNCSVITDLSPVRQGITVFRFIDDDTGELIEIPENDKNVYLLRCTIQEPSTGEIYSVASNPCTVDSIDAYNSQCSYSFHMESLNGWYDLPKFEITSSSKDCVEVTCRLKWTPSGDANGDGVFNGADTVIMQRWLLAVPDTEISDLKALDFCRDGKLNVFDLCAMKRKLVKRTVTECIKPDEYASFITDVCVVEDGLKMYLGPDECYNCIGSIPKGTYIDEIGYQKGNSKWMYTKYDGKYCWIRIVDKNNKNTVYFDMYVDKPVIYLYPEQETDVHAEIKLTESTLSTTYPKYNDGWDVVAYPDGTLLNKADGTHHRYLFWDSTNCRTRFDFSKGFCVAGSDTESFLKEKLTYMGLTEQEMNEFIVYWLPKMEHNAYNLISFQGDAYTDSAQLSITPAPDSMCRVFMAYVPLESSVDVEPQQLETFERK